MAIKKEKKPYVVYITRTGMIWGGDSIKELVNVGFAQDVFFDLEFTNLRSFNNQVLTFIEQYNIKPDKVIFILNQDLYFSLQVGTATEEQIKNYVSLVPFNEVITKRITSPAGTIVNVVSEDLVNPLVEVFTHHGFSVQMVVPDLAFGEQAKTPEQFTQAFIDSIMPNLVSIESYTFYSPPKQQEGMTSIRDSEGRIFNPRLIAMIVFFVVLIGVLLVVLYMNGYLGGKQETPVSTPAPTVQEIVPTAIPEPVSVSVTETFGSDDAQNVEFSSIIEIVSDESTANQAELARTALAASGFSVVRVDNTSTVSQRTLVLYSPAVSADTIDAITTALDVAGLPSSAQENAELTGIDVRITIGIGQ
jgi:hypothetical protein